ALVPAHPALSELTINLQGAVALDAARPLGCCHFDIHGGSLVGAAQIVMPRLSATDARARGRAPLHGVRPLLIGRASNAGAHRRGIACAGLGPETLEEKMKLLFRQLLRARLRYLLQDRRGLALPLKRSEEHTSELQSRE